MAKKKEEKGERESRRKRREEEEEELHNILSHFPRLLQLLLCVETLSQDYTMAKYHGINYNTRNFHVLT